MGIVKAFSVISWEQVISKWFEHVDYKNRCSQAEICIQLLKIAQKQNIRQYPYTISSSWDRMMILEFQFKVLSTKESS